MKTQGVTLYPFIPSGANYELAIKFFIELGFEKVWQHEGLTGLRFGGAYFMLQQIDVPEWQKNQQITYEVNDLEGYWAEISAKNLADKFAGVRLKPPTDFPWGREIHFIDPGGVCWHVRQTKK